MNTNRTLAVASTLFAVISAMFALTDAPYGAAGFAIEMVNVLRAIGDGK